MKHTFLRYTFFLLAFAGFFLQGCEDEDKIRIPEFQDGVNMRFQVDPTTTFIDAANVANSNIILHVFTENTDINKVELKLDYFSASMDSNFARVTILELQQSDFTNGELPNLTISTQDISNAVGIPVDDMSAGDKLTFLNFTTLNDGRIYPNDIVVDENTTIRNVTPNIINSAATTSFTTSLVFFISCPFNADDAVGNYLITRDDFVTTLDIERPIEAVKAGEDAITFINLFSHPEMYDVTVTVNLASGIAAVTRQPAWHCDNFGCGFGEGRVDGGGFFFSCTGFVTLDLRHTVDAGSFGVFKLELQKL